MNKYEARERIKSLAGLIISTSALPIKDRVNALGDLIEMDYWRAYEHLNSTHSMARRALSPTERDGEYKLDLAMYTRHWLHAVGSQMSEQDVIEAFIAETGCTPLESRYLPFGHTCYCNFYK